MEIKFVDADHGYAAFAPEKPISESQSTFELSCSPFAFLSGDVVASERPVVCWQQVISRYPTAPRVPSLAAPNSSSFIPPKVVLGSSEAMEESKRSSQSRSGTEDSVDDIEGSGGGGIFRSCAYCLNSLLTVAEEATRLESIVDSERSVCRSRPTAGDVSVRDLFLQTVLRTAFVEVLPSFSEDDSVSCSSSSSSISSGREINQSKDKEQEAKSLVRYRAVKGKRGIMALAQQQSNSPVAADARDDKEEDEPNAWASAYYLTAIPSHSLDVCVPSSPRSTENRITQLEEGEKEVPEVKDGDRAGEREEAEKKKEDKQTRGNVFPSSSAPPPSYSLILRSVKRTQRHVVLYDGSVEEKKVPNKEREGGDGSAGAWIFSFCDCVCLASFEREFGVSRWLLGQKVVALKRGELGNASGTNDDEEERAEEEKDSHCFDTNNKDTAVDGGTVGTAATNLAPNLKTFTTTMPTSTTRVDPHLKGLFSQYFLFDETFNSRALRKCFGQGEEEETCGGSGGGEGGGKGGSSNDYFASLASSPIVAELRSEVWNLIYTDFILNGCISSTSLSSSVSRTTATERYPLEEDQNQKRHKQEELHGLGSAATKESHEETIATADSDHHRAALGRCLMAIYTLSSTFNERFKMILLVVCKALTSLHRLAENSDVFPSSSSATAEGRNADLLLIASIFSRLETHLLDNFCASYEEGPYRKYTWRQRETLRAFCTLLNEWLAFLESMLLNQEEEENDSQRFSSHRQRKRRYVSIQTVQTISMVLDANTHACVVINPIYAALCDYQQREIETAGVNRNSINEEVGTMQKSLESLKRNQFDGLPTADAPLTLSILIHRFASPNLHHNLGVALYDRCTKINHSCRPNVKFIPTFAPVRAVVVARGARVALLHRAAADEGDATEKGDDEKRAGIGGGYCHGTGGGISWGEEIRTSYLDIEEEFAEKDLLESPPSTLDFKEEEDQSVEEGTSRSNNERRRRLLRENYGFECDCPRCAEEKKKKEKIINKVPVPPVHRFDFS